MDLLSKVWDHPHILHLLSYIPSNLKIIFFITKTNVYTHLNHKITLKNIFSRRKFVICTYNSVSIIINYYLI
jgi:hypothetical protein